jgi:hypothetical protein
VRRTAPLACLAALAVLASTLPARAAEPQARLLKEKADLVVSVKYTLSMTITARGQTQDQEAPGQTTGILVDKAGLVMISNDALQPSLPRQFRSGGIDIKSTPSQIRVTFPGETREYPAILGATESKLGLAFVRIRDLEGKAIPSLAGDAAPEPAAGDRVYGVSRLGEGFDYAPYVDELRVSGRLTKPREMINIEGDFVNLAHPVFDAAGGVVGVLISQQAVNDGGSGVFVLPWKIAAGTIQRALKASETALEEAKAKDAEKAAEGAEAPKPEGDAPKDEPKPDAKDEPKPPSDGGSEGTK